jgi:hypothetical protein
MKTYTIEIFNIEWDADFCGELPSEEVSKIISEQPKSLTISFGINELELEGCNDDIVDDVVSSYICDNDFPCWISNFDYSFVD